MALLARALVALLLVGVSLLRFTDAAPIDCVVGEWTPVSGCGAAPLYARKMTRQVLTKPANDGKACPALFKYARCRPVDCKMTKWSKWSVCQEDGTKTRTRSVARHPRYGGRVCPSQEDTVACTLPPVDCTLDKDWSGWGPCELNSAGQYTNNQTRGIATSAKHGGSCPATDDPSRLKVQTCHPKCGQEDPASYAECAQVMAKFEDPKENAMYTGVYTVASETVDAQWKCAAMCVARPSCRAYSYQTTTCLVSNGDVNEGADFGPDAVAVSALLRHDLIPQAPPE